MGEKQVVLGKVVSAHGVRGAMKILSFTESPENLFTYSPLWAKGKIFTPWTSFRRLHGTNFFLGTCSSIRSREEAATMGGALLTASLPPLNGFLYYADLEQRSVLDMEGNPVGKVLQVHHFGAGPVLEIQQEDKKGALDSVFVSLYHVENIEESPLRLGILLA